VPVSGMGILHHSGFGYGYFPYRMLFGSLFFGDIY
jgi:hypothetical protein